MSYSSPLLSSHTPHFPPRCAGTAAVPARNELRHQRVRRLPELQEDVVSAQPARQELHQTRLPSAALPRAQGDAAANSGEAGGPAAGGVPEDAAQAGGGVTCGFGARQGYTWVRSQPSAECGCTKLWMHGGKGLGGASVPPLHFPSVTLENVVLDIRTDNQLLLQRGCGACTR